MSEMNYELSLSSGKKVTLREPKIGDQELASQACAEKAGSNTITFALMLQSELVKLLLISIDGKVLSGSEKEMIKNLFSYHEFQELLMGMEDILGKPVKPQVKLVKTGGEQ